ncbi:MAG: aminotransferase class V-fold PLP-dependent enzyme [Polaribacter sp.]|uniref:pyridoxal phosphate-dependent decarboxylase family protein n=1 Tax=Polaribacter sp. TaxID=1920175 RepID=UPI002610902A|nr:aminotransferase class V-fold PLP-dependent enzyme [Polaribacter sp.]MBT3741620.1 aminotransferase class V-fold PLP-dependent enzyme [Polaribacter sp.]MDG1194900.1 aminotransferase class V-fold PLP-dependent enzyme [Polaribacter sp.]MDG1403382.1 aminotransferase class V-fold PLP-dependent enzyme [Polaribacter sp.]
MSNINNDLALFNELVEVLITEEEKNPVAERIDSNKLYESIDLSLNDAAMIDDEFKNLLRDVIVSTPKTATNLFFNQLFGGRQSKAVLGDLLAVMLNNSMYTYKVAGPQVGIEQEIIRQSCDLIGYGSKSNGTFPTGGSMSNYMALVMGRDAKDPSCRLNGMTKPMVIYTSKESHYSNSKNASFAGIGRNNIRYIETDTKGRLIPEKLEEQIQEDLQNDKIPTYVNATAGTTVLGAFDPIDKIADITEKYKIWLHVDGAYCGSVIFSDNYNHLVKGVERSNSFSYNAHKMLGTPLTCSIILVNDKKYLHDSFSNDADYLYQTDGDDFNLGKTSFQCGRRNDALKFWTLWKSIGTKGLKKIVEQQFDLANVALDYIRSNPNYTLYSFDDSISICFNYKNIEPMALCTALYEHQITLVGFGSFEEDTFIRLVTINANNEKQDILHFFKVLEDFVDKTPSLKRI